MKKILVLVLALFSVLLLTACDNITNIINNLSLNTTTASNGGETTTVVGSNGQNDGGDGDLVEGDIVDEEESKNKLKEIGDTIGFEITLRTTSSEEDEEGEDEEGEDEASVSEFTIGIKNSIFWTKDEGTYTTAYKLEENTVQWYSYEEGEEEGEGGFIYCGEADIQEYESSFNNITMMFYMASDYVMGEVRNVGQVLMLGRQCTKYSSKMDFGAYGSLSYNIVIDNETGITMKIEATAENGLEGSTDFATYEVVEFKTGDSVTTPELPLPVFDGGEED